MTDLLLHIGISKLIISVGLAFAAWAVQRWRKQPFLSHPLWLLVLATLVLPPVVNVPVAGFPWLGAFGDAVAESPVAGSLSTALREGEPVGSSIGAFLAEHGAQGLILLCMLGSLVVLIGSLLRVHRFNTLLRRASTPAPAGLQEMASHVSGRLRLTKAPTILTTNAQLSPMVWWIGGEVRVVVPATLLADATPDQLRWILAHELAHVRRWDHMVRWIEWLACVAFWWNPVAWWTRRNLRANEELCCDQLVLTALGPNPRSYANSLLTVLDSLSSPPVLRPPAFASEADNGGGPALIERRLKMILSGGPEARTPLWVRMSLKVVVLALLPLGLVHCGSDDGTGATEPELALGQATSAALHETARPYLNRIDVGVASGALSEEEAARMRAEIKDINARVEAGIDAGEFTLEDVAERVEHGLRAVLSPEGLRPGEGTPGRRDKERRDVDLRRLAQEIHDAMASGKITEEEGREKLEGLRLRIAGSREAGDGVQAALLAHRQRLSAAIKDGRITEDEAKAEYQRFQDGLRRRMEGSEGR